MAAMASQVGLTVFFTGNPFYFCSFKRMEGRKNVGVGPEILLVNFQN